MYLVSPPTKVNEGADGLVHVPYGTLHGLAIVHRVPLHQVRQLEDQLAPHTGIHCSPDRSYLKSLSGSLHSQVDILPVTLSNLSNLLLITGIYSSKCFTRNSIDKLIVDEKLGIDHFWLGCHTEKSLVEVNQAILA